ncbi:MAG TPA: hypothetical protein VGH13_04265 [Xanthobacteraceae bacterium]|jgi:hypothetical protein
MSVTDILKRKNLSPFASLSLMARFGAWINTAHRAVGLSRKALPQYSILFITPLRYGDERLATPQIPIGGDATTGRFARGLRLRTTS